MGAFNVLKLNFIRVHPVHPWFCLENFGDSNVKVHGWPEPDWDKPTEF